MNVTPRGPLRERALGVLTVLVAMLALGLLATWLPHYLTWPWWPDVDTYAAISLGWEHGVLPYRDVVIFNFPGQIYLHWLVGKVFGWGHTAPIYAVDAGLLVGLGILLAGWSRRRFGRRLPGLVGFLAILGVYLNLDYSLVVQRDWQGPLLVAVAMLGTQASPRRWARFGSALAFAAAVSVRPHVLLFLPAMTLALDDGARRPDESLAGSLRPLLEWGLAFVFCVLLLMLPMILCGILGDHLRILATIKNLPLYAKTSWRDMLWVYRHQFSDVRVGLVFVANLVLAGLSSANVRRCAAPWIVALLLATAYRPFHPLQHAYLSLPLELFWALNVGVTVALVLAIRTPVLWVQVAAALAVLLLGLGGVPTYCRPIASLHALKSLGRPGEPPEVPPGAEGYFPPLRSRASYTWDDYRDALAYLRGATEPETRIVTVIRNAPYLTFNGPVGRITPLPADTGVLWIWQVDPSMEEAFVTAMRNSRDSVVVWVPGETSARPGLQLPIIAAAIPRFYRPEARFGLIEVWRRRADDSGD